MNKNVARRFFLALLGVVAIAGGVCEAQTTTTSHPVTATCSGGGQLCDNVDTIAITTTGILQAQFVSDAPFSCSNVRIHFLVDGSEVAVTGFVPPAGSSSILNLGPVSPGSHTLGLQAEGQVSGCNVGTLASWAGTALVTTGVDASAGNPIPVMSEWMMVLLTALLGALGALYMRRT